MACLASIEVITVWSSYVSPAFPTLTLPLEGRQLTVTGLCGSMAPGALGLTGGPSWTYKQERCEQT